MKKLKSFKLFESSDINNGEIHQICRDYGIKNYTINSDGSIDVNGDVDLYNINLKELPLKFRNVTGDFYCSYNQLTSLEGCPESVGSSFVCYNNKLTSLKGCPKIIGFNFLCGNNNIDSFEYFPEYVGSDIYLEGNPIEPIWNLFDDIKHIELFNDMDILRENYTLILDRLNDFLEIIGEPTVTSVNGWKCI